MALNSKDLFYAFLLTLLAGLSTGIGSILAFYTKQTNKRFLSVTLGFSAGVMIYVSMIEIFAKARASLETVFGPAKGLLITTMAFFGGILLIALIDKFVPDVENPHAMRGVEEMSDSEPTERSLLRMGLFSALAIAIHNFPEGLATFVSALQDPTLGISITVAIALHNIPEGLAVSVPVYYATGNRRKAFFYSFLSGFSEPLGAIIGYFLLMKFFSPALFGLIFAGVAGIMVYISLDELLSTAEKYGEHHIAIYGLISGMFVMALSLVLFA